MLWSVGCSSDFVANSAGVWPKIVLNTPEQLTPEGLAAFNEVAKRFPADAKIIIGRNNELVAKITEYNKRARDHNRELYKNINMAQKDIDLLEP